MSFFLAINGLVEIRLHLTFISTLTVTDPSYGAERGKKEKKIKKKKKWRKKKNK